MKCPMETGQGPEMLLTYISGEMNTEAEAAFAEHTRNCEACRKAVEAQHAVWHALDAWEAPPVSADFDRRLYARIEKETFWWDRLTRPLRPMLTRRALPFAAAVAAIIAAVLVESPSVTPQPAVPESAQVETVAPDQAENTLQDMETLREFSRIMHSDTPAPKM